MKKVFIAGTLTILIVLTVIARIGNMPPDHVLTLDENVYANLAAQVLEDPENYNVIEIGNKIKEQGWRLPEYFDKPLFKHPPVFIYFICTSYLVFGKTYLAAFYVSLLFGLLIILMTYFLGKELFDERCGLYAALIMAVEPVVWICSQKIWMETTLAFFMVFSFYFFVLYTKKRNWFFITVSCVSAGFAALTKYPGILSFFFILIYSLAKERGFFRDKKFIISLALPLIMFIPWLKWNYGVYGANITSFNREVAQLIEKAGMLLPYAPAILLSGVLLTAFVMLIKKTLSGEKASVLYKVLAVSFVLGVMLILRTNIFHAFNFGFTPRAGWEMGMFRNEPWFFYFGRLLELSPFYIFSFIGVALIAFDPGKKDEYTMLFLFAGTILVFYVFWGNYQSRYIASAVAPLIVVSARCQVFLADSIGKMKKADMKKAMYYLLVFVVIFFMLKTLFLDETLAIPNAGCYF